MLVFISYHNPDHEKARAVEAALAQRRPEDEWYFAPRNVTGGAWWVPHLADAVARADAMLFLAGRQIGPWQQLEYYEALRLSRARGGRPRLIPVVIAEQAPGLPFFSQLHQIFAADPTAREALDAIERSLDDSLPPDAAPAWRRFQPYKGLPALEEADAAFFFGRDNETAAIIDLMARHPDRIIALVGQSGVGKSSLARAGVLARLKSQLWPLPEGTWPAGLRDSGAFLSLVIRPDEQPLKELARAFAQLYCTKTFEFDEEAAGWARRFADGAGLRDMLRATRGKLADALGAEPPKRFVIYIDQGEELYTRGNADEARRFSALIAEAARHEAFSVLLSLRSDYYAAYQNDRDIFDASEHVDVLSLTRDVLGEVIRRPASSLGAQFESGDIAERVADATEREPGALPLLSDLLHEMWLHMQARGDGVLRWSDNPEIVDVAAPLRRRAEAFLANSTNAEADLRRLFTLRLAHVPEIGEPVRRRAHRSECSADEWAAAEKLAAQNWRLLTLARAADGEPVVEVAHEQLLRRWPRLKTWLDEEREFLVWKGQVEHAAACGALPKTERDGALLMGRPLAVARGWFEHRAADLNPAARDFVAASLAADSARREAEQRRKRRVQIGTTVGLVVATVLAVFAWRQSLVARNEKAAAEHSLKLATQTANGLVEGLAMRFQNFGLPAATVQDILNHALKLQDQLAVSGGSTPDLRSSQGRALNQVSSGFRDVGNVSGALSSALQARDIFESLLAADPDNTNYKENLDASFVRIGEALEDQGDHAGALSAYRESLRLAKSLIAMDTRNDGWQQRAEYAYEMIGGILRQQGNLRGSIAALQEDLAIAKMLATKNPDDLDLQFDLSESDNRLGDALIDQHDITDAIAAYRDGLTIREALIEKNTTNLFWQGGLAQSKLRIGDALGAKDLNGALGAYQGGFAILDMLVKKDPSNAALQADLADCEGRIGDTLQARGDRHGALAAYHLSLANIKALTQKDPGNGDWQRRLASTKEAIGDALQAQGDRAGALTAYRESLAISRALIDKDPSNAYWQSYAATTDNVMGDVLREDDHAGSIAAYRESLAIRRVLAQKNPSNVDSQTNLVFSLWQLADAGDEPATNLSEALAILKRLDTAGSLPPEAKEWASKIEAKLAKTPLPGASHAPDSALGMSDDEALRRGDDTYARKQYGEAMRWYQSAARHGNAQAQANISRMYSLGQGIPTDYGQAMQWARKAADQSNPLGQNVIGVLYSNGWGVAQDYAEAMRWFSKGADQGYASAQANIGAMYNNGWGVKQDYAEAMTWFRKAGDQGNADAQNDIGLLYEDGKGVAQDYAEAMNWLRKAADQGNADAQNNVGAMYSNGWGVKQDYAEAMTWFRKAADQGSANAEAIIGVLYENGEGVVEDYAVAMSWYRKAADQGNAWAQYAIGSLYANGKGVPRDENQARAWIQKAADAGDDQAKEWLASHISKKR